MQIGSRQPSDMTLYAKWIKEGPQDSSSGNGSGSTSEGSSPATGNGCGSAFAVPLAAFAAVGFAAVLLSKRNKKD